MKILFVAAEAAPVVKVGGLADVVTSLSNELIEQGHDVRIMMPKYSMINSSDLDLNPLITGFEIAGQQGNDYVNVLQSVIKQNIKTYILENAAYFEDGEVYGGNELQKFLFFSRAVINLLTKLDWQPDIIHCHDWHTSLISMFIKKMKMPFNTVLTIHNLFYQGAFAEDFLYSQGLDEYWNNYPSGISEIPHNFLGQGILNSDLITTVSKNYAREILISGNGEGLDEILNFKRNSISGIVNGIDYEAYNPQTDRYLAINYSDDSLEGRLDNKSTLKNKLNLGGSEDIPLIGFVQRLDEQKGIDILAESLEKTLKDVDAQFIILGKGKPEYEDYLKRISIIYPEKLSVNTGFDDELAHLIYAGCDMNLIPSLFEPCGLGQLISMHYGSLPVVRHTGGLVDTVPPFNGNMTTGNGFVFYQYSAQSLISTLRLAIEKIKNKAVWLSAMKRVMQMDLSWRKPALEYESLYRTFKS